ncbi:MULTISPECIES: cytochrome C assembly family protein [Priestia]|jgi:HemX protein|uniref:HemX family protein n=1 Tax=Priestia endophytica DSM 13796 TaxID=1121089 RepID=A0A1I5WPX7_9BACI|nr:MULTISPECIES: cytochrome c biogenesis protein [Priestia]KAB2495670.1 cytochrome C assembly protein [Priestia endophytica]KYG36237.1 cytochrome C assembly protein [Priestia endophytica]MBG9815176.1 cytochrome C assembly protein [Priestia endophytica]MCM3539786.1 cytochrome c biogenesis protein [Priestia endophytica]MED4070741.1 cytochrome c biogenesis protein [Priestia endophytica]
MVEINLTRIYELVVVLYAISVLLYFIDFLLNNRKANRTAFWLLAIVWVLQTFFLLFRMIETGRFPILTIFEGIYFYAWVLITLSLLINRFLRVDFLVFFTNVIGFFVMALHTFVPMQDYSTVQGERLVSELLIFHITMAILSYGAFSISFVFSSLYVLQYHLLKKKKWGKRLIRLGDLSRLDYLSYLLNVVALPLLLLSLLLGVMWAYMKLDQFHWYDVKVLGSFLVLIVYSVYLYVRISRGQQGKSMAFWNMASFLILLINFFLFGSLSNFHFWNS